MDRLTFLGASLFLWAVRSGAEPGHYVVWAPQNSSKKRKLYLSRHAELCVMASLQSVPSGPPTAGISAWATSSLHAYYTAFAATNRWQFLVWIVPRTQSTTWVSWRTGPVLRDWAIFTIGGVFSLCMKEDWSEVFLEWTGYRLTKWCADVVPCLHFIISPS